MDLRHRIIRLAYSRPDLRSRLWSLLKLARAEMSLDEAYKVLGLTPGASRDDMVKKYRQLSLAYHPDRNPENVEEATEKQKLVNIAREIIESGGKRKRVEPPHETQAETYWDRYRSRFGPKPSGNYSVSDLNRFAKDVFDKDLRQMIIRYEVPHVPVDAYDMRGNKWTYWRPFGGKTRTSQFSPEATPEQLAQDLAKLIKGTIWDIVVKDKQAWVTWESKPRGMGYRSISFEEPKKKERKKPGVGMKPADVDALFKKEGLDVIAGGTKYAYWGPRGQRRKLGYFIRVARRSLRPVKRWHSGRKIEDMPVAQEFYYGKVTPELMTKWCNWVKKRNAEWEMEEAKAGR